MVCPSGAWKMPSTAISSGSNGFDHSPESWKLISNFSYSGIASSLIDTSVISRAATSAD